MPDTADNPSENLITLSPSGQQFPCLPGQSILDSGLKAGLSLPYRCSNGSCGECRARLLEGDIRQIKPTEFPLTETDRQQGICLPCGSTAETPITLELVETERPEDIPHQSVKAKRCDHQVLADITIVCFKLIRGGALRFLPGQQVTVKSPGKISVSLPIASCPCNANTLEFHLPHAGGSGVASLASALADEVDAMKPVARVSIEGPGGKFVLDNKRPEAFLFLAEGIGFAPMQGMIEQVFNREPLVPSALIWLSTESLGHYRHNLCRSWHDAFDEFDYLPLTEDSSLESEITNRASGDTIIYCSGSMAYCRRINKVLDSLDIPPERRHQMIV